MRNQQKNQNSQHGFTLIELLVVVSIIALLTSIALIALQQAREKSRNVKRLADITQMASILELYFNTNRGYPTGTLGQPVGVTPIFLATLPQAPTPPDGVCDGMTVTPCGGTGQPVCGTPANTYYYAPSGTPVSGLYRDYDYYFCLGQDTGNFSAGPHVLTPEGLK